MTYIFLTVGILCLLYCAGILISGVFGSWFFLIWGAAGAGFMALAWMWKNNIISRLPAAVKLLLVIVLAAGILVFLFIEGLIISRFHSKGEPGLDYLIVLGAQMRDSGPSKALALRLDTAVTYLEENEATLVVVSGGKGSNEPVSEAQGMFDYLVAKGIAPERIVMEDKSTNTKENLEFSQKLIPEAAWGLLRIISMSTGERGLRLSRALGPYADWRRLQIFLCRRTTWSGNFLA